MRKVFELTTSSKLLWLAFALSAWPLTAYFYHTGETFRFWVCLLGIPCATWFAVMTLTTRYIIDDAGITVTGSLQPRGHLCWTDIASVSCTTIKPFAVLPTMRTYKLKTKPAAHGKFAPSINISTESVKHADQLIRGILNHLPSSTQVDPEVFRSLSKEKGKSVKVPGTSVPGCESDPRQPESSRRLS